MFFNYTDKSLTVRFEKLVNFSRLNEYLNVSYPGYKTPDQYQLISNNKTGNFDVVAYLAFNSSIAESELNVQFTRVVNWNYGDPTDFYTIKNITYSQYAGWYDTSISEATRVCAIVIGVIAKVLIIGGSLFDPNGMTKIIKL